MIDTVALRLVGKNFRIFDYSKFTFSSFKGTKNFTKAVYNTKINIVGYKPKLTYYNRFGAEELRVEFSCAKMIYGNNFDEVDENDFEPLIKRLASDLLSVGVQVFPYELRNAQVSKIDYSKNIVFTDGTKSSTIIHELSKADVSKKLDVTDTKYRIGQNLQYHANSYEYVFYDKLADLQQAKISEKRAIEKDNYIQLNLFDGIQKTYPFEVFRLEIRLNKRQKIKKTFAQIGIDGGDLTFQGLFKQEISRQVLLYFWLNTMDGLNLLMTKDNDLADILEKVLLTNKHTLNRSMTISSGIVLLDTIGARRFRQIISPYCHDKTYYSLRSDISECMQYFSKNAKYKTLLNIGKKINNFEKTELKNYPPIT